MKESQTAKFAVAIAPAAIIDNTSATATAIDTNGYDDVEIALVLGATDIAITALKVQESDDDSSYTDITDTVVGTAEDIDGNTDLPSATDDNSVILFNIDMLGKKRYLKVVATFGDGTAGGYLSGVARLSRGETPTDASSAGALLVMRA